MKYAKLKFSIILSSCFVVSACVHVHHPPPPPRAQPHPQVSHGHGPPPHAPAHGYRHKHGDGRHLEYDAGLGLYVAVGSVGVYYHNDHYLRISGDHWEVSIGYEGPWMTAELSSIPESLKHKHKGKAKGKKNKPGKGRGKGKK